MKSDPVTTDPRLALVIARLEEWRAFWLAGDPKPDCRTTNGALNYGRVQATDMALGELRAICPKEPTHAE